MKTKLLKKVRRRFSINRIEIASNFSEDSIYSVYKTPFFEVLDNNEIYTECFQNYPRAYGYLIKCIRSEYGSSKKQFIKRIKIL